MCCLVNRGTMGVNSLPKTVTRQRRDCDLNPGRSAPESSTLTTRLPSHPSVDIARCITIPTASLQERPRYPHRDQSNVPFIAPQRRRQLYYAPALRGHFGIARSVRLSVRWRSCLGRRHAGCLQLSHRRPPEMCGLRTRPRTDVDPPRFLPLSNCHRPGGGISSRRPRRSWRDAVRIAMQRAISISCCVWVPAGQNYTRFLYGTRASSTSSSTSSSFFLFFVFCLILFICVLSICNSYNYYMYMFRRPALMVYSFW